MTTFVSGIWLFAFELAPCQMYLSAAPLHYHPFYSIPYLWTCIVSVSIREPVQLMPMTASSVWQYIYFGILNFIFNIQQWHATKSQVFAFVFVFGQLLTNGTPRTINQVCALRATCHSLLHLRARTVTQTFNQHQFCANLQHIHLNSFGLQNMRMLILIKHR